MKRLTIMMLGALLISGTAMADDAKSGGLFDGFRKKIELLTPKKKLQTTAAVGGVRGAQADAGELYWKGETTADTSIDAEELAAFEESLTLAEAGNKPQAQKGLTEFIRKYPQSQLRGDAEQMLALLKENKQEPAKP